MSIVPFTLYYAMPAISNLIAQSEDPGHLKENLLSRIDGTFWKATVASAQAIQFDFGSAVPVDYVLIHKHIGGADIDCEISWSTTGAGGSWTIVSTEELPLGKTYLKKFASLTKRYWQVVFQGFGIVVPPQAAMINIGSAVVFDYADVMTPENEEDKAIVTVSDNGIVQGIHDVYKERQIDVTFLDADDTLFAKVKAWREVVGMGLFGVQWGDTALGSEVWMMRRKTGKFDAPPKVGGSYHDVKLSLIGRKE
jgi:hypothetical protein